MNFADNFKFNRKRMGYTQEEIANILIVTPQAVSKWENGLGTPDISLLVPISKIFGITIDELLGNTEKDRDELRIELAITSGDNIDYKEKYNRFSDILRQYPNNNDVLARMISCIATLISCEHKEMSSDEINKLVIKAEGYAERMRDLKIENHDVIYSHAYMADVYIAAKEFDKASKEIEYLPYARYNRARMLGNLNSVQGKFKEAIELYRESISDNIYWLFWDIERLANCDYNLTKDNSYAIKVFKVAYGMLHEMYGENRYPIPMVYSLININIQLAAYYTRNKDIETAFKHLNEYIELHEAYNEKYGKVFETGCVFFPNAMQPFNQYGIHDKKRNHKSWVLKRLSWNSFAELKEDKRFIKLLERVRSWEE